MTVTNFTLPVRWHRLLHPRRGGITRAVTSRGKGAPSTVGQWIEAQSDWLDRVLGDPGSSAALVRAATAHRAGDNDPLGAAVLAAAVLGEDRKAVPSVFVDAWVAEHGLPFAARAVVELFDLQVSGLYRWGFRNGNPGVRLLGARNEESVIEAHRPAADRLRVLLAAADEAAYLEVVAALRDCRSSDRRRVIVSYLLPTETAWATECCVPADSYSMGDWALRSLLLCSLDSAEQWELLALDDSENRPVWPDWTVAALATIAEGVGTAVVPLIADSLGLYNSSAGQRKLMFEFLGEVPTDEAFGVLLDCTDHKYIRPALWSAAQRFPERGLRLLAGTKQSALVAELLALHVEAHRDLTAAALPGLEPRLAAVLAPLLAVPAAPAQDGTPAAAVPELLRNPPWTWQPKAVKPRVVKGLTASSDVQLRWLTGERESWQLPLIRRLSGIPSGGWDGQFDRLRGGSLSWHEHAELFVLGPADRVLPLLADWDPKGLWGVADVLRPIVAEHGTAALPALRRAVAADSLRTGVLLLPFLDLGTARLMADWLLRRGTTSGTARGWFTRYGLAAAALLVPDAVGPAGVLRRRAENALRFLALQHGAEAVVALAAVEYGAEAGAVVAELSAADPLVFTLPARLPVPGDWADLALLPPIALVGGGVLAPEAVGHVCTMLALSRPREPYAGLATVLESCDRASLAAFGWALFEGWRKAAMPAKDVWAFHCLAWIGDETTLRQLAGVILQWPNEGSHQRAAQGLEVLAEIGSVPALMQLHRIAQQPHFRSLKARAREKLDEVAAAVELTQDQLLDRLVPQLGLDADGSTVLDYGPRRFTVGFDEQLRPYVLDQDGQRRKDLPAPGVKDDPVRAPAERKRFGALKKEVRKVAAEQTRRLEAAMTSRRAWTPAEFQELFVDHPLSRHLARRLVWVSDSTAFRIAEDGSLADLADTLLTLPPDAVVRLAHPLLLGDALAGWAELFADYEILQPFPQLGRPVHRLTEEEAAGTGFGRFEGRTVAVGKVLGLQRRGWDRGEPGDGGVETWVSRQTADGRYLVVALDPGIQAGAVTMHGDQTLTRIWLGETPTDYWEGHTRALTLDQLDPVTASEVISDLTELVTT
ncbi:DUF4132 domain-containing protein [Streptacidiphilus sp. N1-12]|uniref:DUF4132 domain-containing protein n=2 Tax=Streptacidiphilus alkalitolerans TaxID=3342712 RepID=A0ABV6WKX4_9ACTN